MASFPMLFADVRSLLTRAITQEEVRSPIFAMGAFKAPGPDGF